ncbi:hypothetical protein [Corallococcus aberystwythensis]|uniref:Caspase family protein n=1 Tax=Corallococcus aberystwythensis TaxID=2316722 RepID=A0A3A8PPM0_9BACT|nr:hypothetical protein [Corallococcus aberystwythensis]RKH58139.1 hypothetical protein D7W81_29610 [Corallococcus aberystwythensis]
MKRNVAVCVGVMVAVAAGAAGAEERTEGTAVSEPHPAPVQEAPPPGAVAVPLPALSPAPLVEAATGGEPARAATVAQRTDTEEIRVPVVLMAMPHVSTAGTATERVVTTFALGALGTHAKRVDGIALSLGANWVGELSGAQLTLGANVVRGPASGAQFAVGGNVVTGDLEGLQSAVGLNVVKGTAAAGQFAVGGNVVGGALSGGQFSVGANIAGSGGVGGQFTVGANIATAPLKGVQAAAGANLAPSMSGLQASAGFNYAGRMEGAQLSLLNVGGDVSGAQVGLVNIAGKADGLQLGLINVARESQGEALGLLSFIGNGQANVQVWASDLAYTNVAVKFGGRHFHTLLTLGFNPGTDTHRRRYVAGMGFGAHIPTGPLFFDLDVIGSSVHADNLFRDGDGLNVLGQLRLVAGWQVAKRFALIGGVTGNTLVTWDNGDRWEELGIGPEWRSVSDGGRTTVRVWPGVLLGVQL